jgi:hypothetical protein
MSTSARPVRAQPQQDPDATPPSGGLFPFSRRASESRGNDGDTDSTIASSEGAHEAMSELLHVAAGH